MGVTASTGNFLIIISIILSTSAQLALKAGMTSSVVQAALSQKFRLMSAIDIIFHPFIIFGLLCYIASVAAWLGVLSRMEVSSAYPFVAVAIVLTAVFGWLLFDDNFSAGKIIGTTLIVIGVVVLARG